MLKAIKNKVSDMMSYPARRNAQKAMLKGGFHPNAKALEHASPHAQLAQKMALRNVAPQRGSIVDNALKPDGSARPALPVKKPQLSQRDQYGRAMERAQRRGGSNGIGVGP